MSQSYTPEFKKKIIRLHIEEGFTYKSITAEYDVSKSSICKWCNEFSKECQFKAIHNPDIQNEANLMRDNSPSQKIIGRSKKRKLILKKKRRHSLQRKSIRGLSIY